MNNTHFNAQHVRKICEHKLTIKFRSGAELNGWFTYKDKRICRVTVPCGRKLLTPKTYSSIAKQLHLSIDNFDELLKCPLKYENYVHLLHLD
jgi:hypothetical protein